MKKIFLKNPLSLWLVKKLTRSDLKRLFEENKSDKKTLIMHCSDAPFQGVFPNRIKVADNKNEGADMVVDYYNLPFKDGEFEIVVCTGLLEHVKEPYKIIQEIKRVLKKGGQLLLSASFAFSIHEAPKNYFHFTPYGLKYLLRDWSKTEIKGSCNTMKTMAILLQRICYQSKMFLPMKILLFLIVKLIPFFQIFIRQEYGDITKKTKIDSILSSNIQVKAIK